MRRFHQDWASDISPYTAYTAATQDAFAFEARGIGCVLLLRDQLC